MLETLWTPSPERMAKTNLTRFLAETGREDFAALYRWSVEDRPAFWGAVARFTGVIWDAEADEVLRDGDRMPGAKWFPGSRLNFARNLLRRTDDHPALVFWNEHGRQRELTYRDLVSQAARFAAALRASGVGPGDRVAAFMPNMPETV
ncbi:MAG: AMP-binding protein, partial [Gemmatimonadetes bacterium]|nr:AMP-binding protein [Gemmatimonadota bacterium]